MCFKAVTFLNHLHQIACKYRQECNIMMTGNSMPSRLNHGLPAGLRLLPRPPPSPARHALRLLLHPLVQHRHQSWPSWTSSTQLLPLPVSSSPLACWKTSIQWPRLLSGVSSFFVHMSPNTIKRLCFSGRAWLTTNPADPGSDQPCIWPPHSPPPCPPLLLHLPLPDAAKDEGGDPVLLPGQTNSCKHHHQPLLNPFPTTVSCPRPAQEKCWMTREMFSCLSPLLNDIKTGNVYFTPPLSYANANANHHWNVEVALKSCSGP